MNNEKISLIVPVYNVEKYLRECIESLIHQTYSNIEIILIDDGSKDGSGNICDEYKNYDNVVVVHKKNEGLGMARNTGMEYATGKYVSFIDSDDYIEKDLIEKLYREIKEEKSDLIKSGFKRVTDEKKVIFERKYKKMQYENENVTKKFLPKLIGSLPNKKDSIEMCVTGGLYKREIIQKNKILFPSERELISEDLVFNIEYCTKIKKVVVSEQCGYFYRFNPKSLTCKYRKDRFEACKKFYEVLANRLKKIACDDSIIRLQKTFFIYLKMCISQEKETISHKSKKEILNKLYDICRDEFVSSIIEEYPTKKLGIKQQIFLFLIKHQLTNILYITIKLGLI